jgi:N-acetyl-gamma-glutamyl-phosphate reductase
MAERARVAILGASGFAGAELLRRLLFHPAVEVVRVVADDHLGAPVAAAHPHLEGLTDLRFEPFAAERAVDVDFVLMGLPPDASFEVVRAAHGRGVRLIDLSGAFRLKDPALFERFYGRAHPLPELLSEFVYGLPELNRERVRSARYVSSPGCFATTITLGLLPLARAGLLSGAVQTVAITGSSGAGKEPSATTHHPTRAGNVRTYKPLTHPHAPEVAATLTQAAGRAVAVDFVPVSGPYVRGIFATSFVPLPDHVSEDQVREAFEASYAAEPLIRVPHGRLPEVVAVAGSCYAEAGFVFRPRSAGGAQGASVTVFSALDNLIKGGAGQAVQNLNLMLGVPETTGLTDPGPYP